MPLFRRAMGWATAGAVGGVLLISACRDAHGTGDHSAAEQKEDEKAAEAVDAAPSDPREGLDNHAYPLLIWASRVVAREYFDAGRFDPQAQLVAAATLLGLHTPEFFSEVIDGGTTLKVTVRSRSAEIPLRDLTGLEDAALGLEQILEFAQSVLNLEDEPRHELEYAAINGLFSPLDPHTILLTPEEHADLGVRTRGRFGGIGAEILAESRRILIVKVLPGMPADKAGVRAGDVVLKIDNVSTVNMTAAEAQELLRGQLGAVVVVKIKRGDKTLEFEIPRGTIRIDSVRTELLPGAVHYIQVSNFQQDTSEKLSQVLSAAEAPAGIVLDLRGNTGGLLTQATSIVDLFVARGDLLIVRSAAGREVDVAHEDVGLDPAVPLVVLVDEESASSAEIVSGGLQALGRAVVVGRSSFGKGTVQMVKEASPYGRELALKLTVAEWLVSGDKRIQTFGVLPDLSLQPVELSGIVGIARFFDDERFERQRERSRTANLPSAKHDPLIPAEHRAAATLRYLWTTELPDGLWPDTKSPVPEMLRDPEVRIARAVALALAGAQTAEERRTRLTSLSEGMARAEDTRIVQALAKTKIDWSAGPTNVSLNVGTRVLDTMPIAAGEPFTVEVAVQNTGVVDAHRVHVMTDCVHDELDGIELLVGTVAAGTTETRTMRLHVMPWHTDFVDSLGVVVHAGEPDAEPDASVRSMFEVRGAPRPALSYDYWIVDDPALVAKAPRRPKGEPVADEPPWHVMGNGDGVLQAGEQVLLAFDARNDGAGDSPDVRAILRNLSGEQGLLEEGVVELGALTPRQSRAAAFGITVGAHADPAKPFEVEMAVGDGRMRARAQDKLRFRIVADAGAMQDEPKMLEVVGEPVRLYAGAHASMPIVAELPVGTVLHSPGVVRGWRVVQPSPGGRRYFIPDGKSLVEAKPAAASPLDVASLHAPFAVLPPTLTLEAFPKQTSAPEITLSGIVSHPQRVRDVVVMVRPPGTAQIEQKVAYEANASVNGEAARTLEFHAKVPLERGGNRITILARDGAKVEQRHDVWVYRDEGLPTSAGVTVPAGG